MHNVSGVSYDAPYCIERANIDNMVLPYIYSLNGFGIIEIGDIDTNALVGYVDYQKICGVSEAGGQSKRRGAKNINWRLQKWRQQRYIL